MSGWRIVPVELPNNFSIGRRREYIFATTGLPEPDWPALTSALIEAAHGSGAIVIKRTDSYCALTAAVRATFGGAK